MNGLLIASNRYFEGGSQIDRVLIMIDDLKYPRQDSYASNILLDWIFIAVIDLILPCAL